MPRTYKAPKLTNNAQQTTAFQYLALLLALTVITVLNVSMFFMHGGSTASVVCSTDSMIGVVARYLVNNGQTTLRELLPTYCAAEGFGEKTEKEMEISVRSLMEKCRKEKQKMTQKTPILTLFTTFASHNHSDSEKFLVHNNTLANWAKFKPRVNLVLFSNDTSWTATAKNNGWHVLKPLQDENNGQNPPVLKTMFSLVMERYETLWYGYVNADILFTNDLVSNLEFISKQYNATTTKLLLTGRRTNVANLTDLDPLSDFSIKRHVEKFGELYREDAEDFFITTKSFPWQLILPVVVGRPGYDNWLVGEARCRLNTTVIDVTETMLACHQTTKKGGNSEGHLHPNRDLNYKVLKDNNIVPNFLAGLTSCITYRSFRTFCDSIEITKRTKFGPACNCKQKMKEIGGG